MEIQTAYSFDYLNDEISQSEAILSIIEIFDKELIPALIKSRLTQGIQLNNIQTDVFGQGVNLIFTLDLSVEELTNNQVIKLQKEIEKNKQGQN